MLFKFSSPQKSHVKGKRPLSANIRISGSKTQKPKFSKRNQNNPMVRLSKEGALTAPTDNEFQNTMTGSGMMRENSNYPSYFKSPGAIQKRIMMLEKKKVNRQAVVFEKEYLYDEALKNK